MVFLKVALFIRLYVVKSLSSERVLLSCCVTPSQRIREQPHHDQLWIHYETSGEIVCSYCSCTAGLYKVEFSNIKGFNDPVCTEKSCVTPSQRIREQPHHDQLWILYKTSREIVCSYCSCTVGLSKCCNHVIAALYKVEFSNIKGFNDPVCTCREILCMEQQHEKRCTTKDQRNGHSRA